MHRKLLCLVCFAAVVVLLTGICAQGARVRSESDGFSLAVPDPCQPTDDRLSSFASDKPAFVATYTHNKLIYYIVASEPVGFDGNATASSAIDTLLMMLKGFMSMGGQAVRSLQFETPQEIICKGFGAVNKEYDRTSADGKVHESNTIKSPLIKGMFGSSCYTSMIVMPLKQRPAKVLVIAVIGATDNAGGVESALRACAESVKLDDPEAARATVTAPTFVKPTQSAARKEAPSLNRGEMGLKGTVTAIDKQAKSLEMLVNQVSEFGKQPVVLNPSRTKKVFYSWLPSDVDVKSNVFVIGKSAGAGKPMQASLIVLQP